VVAQYRISREEASKEVEANYSVFVENLSGLLADNKGAWCLLHDKQIIGFYSTLEDAYRGGVDKYPDRRFSVQEVTDTPLRMGVHAVVV